MAQYEIIYIVHPDLDEGPLKEIIERVSGWIEEGGGTVSKMDLWGKRKLAYPIRKKNEGYYVLLEAQLEPAFCATLERNFNLLEPVMRYLIARVD
jgi:small subunit ribosomal protein S6